MNSQVQISAYKNTDDLWSFTLNNITKNTYKIFLESFLSGDNGKLLFREASEEFLIQPGIMKLTEKDMGPLISKPLYVSLKLNSDFELKLSICVRQKFGPDLGTNKIEI